MAQTTPTYRWRKILDIRGGHRFFRDESTGRYAVADRSGHIPERTDDGVLWLDFDRPLLVDDGRVMLPVLSEGGAQCSVGLTHEGAARLQHALRDAGGGGFTVTADGGWLSRVVAPVIKRGDVNWVQS